MIPTSSLPSPFSRLGQVCIERGVLFIPQKPLSPTNVAPIEEYDANHAGLPEGVLAQMRAKAEEEERKRARAAAAAALKAQQAAQKAAREAALWHCVRRGMVERFGPLAIAG